MSQEQLRRLLSDSAEQIEVRPAPDLPTVRAARPRRRLALAAVAVAAAGALVAGLVLVGGGPDDDSVLAVDPRAGARQVPLLTGAPLGGPAMEALTGGRLAVDARGCGVLESGDTISPVLWPGGWTAYDVDGRLELRDDRGRVRVREGDWVEAGGGFGARRDLYAGQACAPRGGGVFQIQSEPEVVPPTEVELLSDGARPGNGRVRAIGGVLAARRGCLLFTTSRLVGPLLTVWPEGWTAGTDPDGVTTVRDTDGVPRARTGESVQVTGTRRGRFAYGGSYSPQEPAAGPGCGRGAVFVRDATTRSR